MIRDKTNIPQNYNYVIKINQKATEEKLNSGDIKLVKWLRHPLDKRYSTHEIVESWNNNFHFIEENLEENIKGLREPQIAALYSILSHFKVPEDESTMDLLSELLKGIRLRDLNKGIIFSAIRDASFIKM